MFLSKVKSLGLLDYQANLALMEEMDRMAATASTARTDVMAATARTDATDATVPLASGSFMASDTLLNL
jgi:hypothetical protein